MVPAFAEVNLVAQHPDMQTLDGIWQRVLKCAKAGALATETRLEVVQSTNYANTLPNDAFTALVSRNMKKAGGYEYTADERKFAEAFRRPAIDENPAGPEQALADTSEAPGVASTDVGDVSWNLPTVGFTAATYAPGTSAHSWQAAAQAGTSIGRKGMLVAARTLALSAIELIENPSQIDAAKTSFEKRKAGRAWTTRIAAGSKPPLDYAMK